MFAFTVAVAAAAATGQIHLADALREAQERNPEILAANEQVRAAQAAIAPAGALDDPMLMLQLWNTPIDFSNVPLMLQLTQHLPLGGKRDARREAALADWRVAQSSAAAKVRDVEQDVDKAYFDLFLAERTIEVDGEIEKQLQSMLTAASIRVAAGTGEQVDELKAQGEILKLQADEETAEAQRAGANARLAVLLDRDPEEDVGHTAVPAMLPSLPSEEELRDKALTARPELTAAKAMIAGAEEQLRLAGAERVPDLDVSAGFMHTFGSVDGERNFLFLGVQGNLPVFSHEKNQPRIDAASARIEAAKRDERSLQNRIFSEIAQAYAEVKAEEKLVLLHHKLVPVTRQTLESALASYAAGRTTFLTVLDSERELLMHQIDLARHLAAYEQHVAELEHAVGADLGLSAAAAGNGLNPHFHGVQP